MTLHHKLLDQTGWKLLEALQKNGRSSYRALGKHVGLSTPAVSERISKLEEAGIITGYRALLDLEKLDRAITAFVSIQTTPETSPPLITFVQSSPVVLEAHYITGEASFILKIAVSSIRELEQFIQELSHYGRTLTSIVMSTHVQNKVIVEPVTAE